MFSYFEKLVDPFPAEAAQQPPKGVFQFCRYYTRGMEGWLLLMAILTAKTAKSQTLHYRILPKLDDNL